MNPPQAHQLQHHLAYRPPVVQECNNVNFAREIDIITLQNLPSHSQQSPPLRALRASVVQSPLSPSLLLPPPAARDWVLRTAPPWPWGVTVVLFVAAALLIYWLYLRGATSTPRRWRIVLAALRLTLVAVIGFMCYRAELYPYRVDLPDLVVLLDNSTSMSLTDRVEQGGAAATQAPDSPADTASRLARATDLLLASNARLLRDWRSRYRVQLHTLDGQPLSVDEDVRPAVESLRRLRPTVPASRLGTAVQGVLEAQRGRSTAAIVLLTDGNTTEGPSIAEAAAAATARRIPLFTVGVGRRELPPDVALQDLLVDRVVFVDDVVTFDVAVAASGLAGKTVRLTLTREGDSSELASETLSLPADQSVRRVRLLHRPQAAGRETYVVQAEVLTEETRADNNSVRADVQVRDDSIRVLLVQSVPSFEYRYLKSLLGRQQRGESTEHGPIVQLTSVLQEADPEYAESDSSERTSFPPNRQELLNYDVLLWGDVNAALLGRSALQDVADYVREDGRGIVLIAGPSFVPGAYANTPLEDLLPFRLADLPMAIPSPAECRLQLTPLGLSAPHMQLATSTEENLKLWNDLPPVRWFLPIRRVRPGVRVLATCAGDAPGQENPQPLISLHYAGSGKVLFHAMDETYRWRFRQGDSSFGRYWLQTVRWLSRAKLAEDRAAELQVEHDHYDVGDPIRLRATFWDEGLAPDDDQGVTVVLQRAEGDWQQRVTMARQQAERGKFEALLPHLDAGNYRAWIASPVLAGELPACDFSVSSGNPELKHLTIDEPDLQQAAKLSGGRYYTLEKCSRLTASLPPGRAVRVESLAPIPIWNSSITAALCVALLVAEWLLRRRLGMG